MKYFLTLLIFTTFSQLFAQEWIYKPIANVANSSVEAEGDFKQRNAAPGKGKKGVDGWYVLYANSFVKNATKITSEEAHSGSKSLKVQTTANANVLYKGLVKHDPIKVKSPGKYQVSFWIKSSNPNAEAKIQVFTSKDQEEKFRKINSSGKNVPLKNTKPVVEDFSLSKEWKQINKQVILTKKDIEQGYVYIIPSLLIGKTPNVTFYIDDVAVEYVMKKQAK